MGVGEDWADELFVDFVGGCHQSIAIERRILDSPGILPILMGIKTYNP